MKALWHTINALKVHWHVPVPIRSIFPVPLRRLKSLVSTDTQVSDSLSRLCVVHVGLSLRLKNQLCSMSTWACMLKAPTNLQTAISTIVVDHN